MSWYLYIREHPGNPWGPFDSLEAAQAHRRMLSLYWRGITAPGRTYIRKARP